MGVPATKILSHMIALAVMRDDQALEGALLRLEGRIVVWVANDVPYILMWAATLTDGSILKMATQTTIRDGLPRTLDTGYAMATNDGRLPELDIRVWNQARAIGK
jgi:hypothetical protein